MPKMSSCEESRLLNEEIHVSDVPSHFCPADKHTWKPSLVRAQGALVPGVAVGAVGARMEQTWPCKGASQKQWRLRGSRVPEPRVQLL